MWYSLTFSHLVRDLGVSLSFSLFLHTRRRTHKGSCLAQINPFFETLAVDYCHHDAEHCRMRQCVCVCFKGYRLHTCITSKGPSPHRNRHLQFLPFLQCKRLSAVLSYLFIICCFICFYISKDAPKTNHNKSPCHFPLILNISFSYPRLEI